LIIGAVERHVQGADEEHVPLDGDGFLDLDMATGMTPAADLAGRSKSFVLLAPGGVGKSVVLDDLRRREDGFEVDLIGLRGVDIGQAVRTAIASGKPIYFDSLDEALLTEPALVRLVNRAMSGPGTDGVRWRLACRPSAWTGAFVDGVKNVEKLRLLPMTRDAARHLLASIDVDEGFLEALAVAGRSRLSASLLHFIAAARRWQEEGRLPGRRADVLESEVQRLLAEREDLRQPLRMGADMRRRTAGRLAVFAAFGGIGRFAFRTGAGQAAVAIAELPSVPEPDRPDATIGREVYAEVLGSALFDTAPGDTVAFRHREYVDYLAAKYVVDRAPVRSQVAGLLGLTDGVLPRSMVAVAAWMVALRPELAEVVAPANAVALIEEPEVGLHPAAQATVVDALLADARDNDAPPRWSLDLSVIVHAELERQLTDRLATGTAGPFEAWWICRLALAGRVSAAAPAALTIALDGRFPSWARRPAIAVVTELGTEPERSAVLDGLKLDPDADPDDELRAGLLDGLYPRHMTTTQLLPFVTRPRQFTFIGAYRKFLWEFAARVPDADLPEVLAWARATLRSQISVESRQWSSDVSVRIVARAVAASDAPEVLEQLADLVVDLTGYSRVGVPWAQDTSRRRRLALVVASRLDEHRWPLLLQLSLVTADDIDWLTDAVYEQQTTGHDVLDRCLQRLIAPPVPADDEPETDKPETEDRPDPAALRAAIAATRQNLAAWADIPIALVPGNKPEPLFFCDLTARQGWSLLTTDEHREILDRGLEYVTGHSPDPGLWLGKTSIGLDVIRAWSGVYLLTTLARHAPERLSDLPPTTWTRWAPAIANAWAHGHEHLLADLVDLAPAEAKAEIHTAVRVALDSSAEWRRTPLYEYFARDLAPDLAAVLPQRRYPDEQSADVLAFLIEHDRDVALVAARSVADGDDSLLSRAANRYLAGIDSHGTIDRLLSEPIPPSAVLKLLEGLQLDSVDDGRLAALARLLLGRLPLADDDPRETKGWLDSPALRGARMRNHAVEMLAMRGLVTELRKLTDGQPPQEQALIRHHLRQARQVAADNAHCRLGPSHLLDLLGRSDPRLIRNSADLIRALLDHFDELQHEISRNNGFRDLWSPNGKDLGSEDDITDWVRRRLTERLGRDRVILTREPQVERIAVKGSGTRIDLTAGAPTNTAPVGVAGAIIEAKMVSNDEVPTALGDQLVKRYLAATSQRHGIYLVYWLPPEQRNSGLRTMYADKQKLLDDMRRWAAEVAPQYDVSVYVLDVSWPKRQP
jgi:hypothetical protein